MASTVRPNIPCTKYKYLVVDLDDCLLTTTLKNERGQYIPNLNPNSLSNDLIKRAKEGGYHGFYVCTHRHYLAVKNGVIERNFQYDVDFLRSIGARVNLDIKNYYTHQIVKNFAKATDLTCVEVSTSDDLVKEGTCGSGYKQILEPYEKIKMQSRKHVVPENGVIVGGHLSEEERKLNMKSKLKQLRQIRDHSLERSLKMEEERRNGKNVDAPPESTVEVELHYFDDRKELGEEAVQKLEAKDNVTFRAFHHYPAEGVIATEIKREPDVVAVNQPLVSQVVPWFLLFSDAVNNGLNATMQQHTNMLSPMSNY